MMNELNEGFVKLDTQYPLIQFLIPYIVVIAVGVLVIAIIALVSWSDMVRGFSLSALDKLLTMICTAMIVLWSVFVAVFVFPFYCYRNRDQLATIRESKKKQKVK